VPAAQLGPLGVMIWRPIALFNIGGVSMNIELLKVALDFISKLIYPIIIGIVIVILYPKIQDIDLKALSSRLQSAKVGNNEFTFSEAEKVGAETAPLNQKVAALELEIGAIKSSIKVSGTNSSPQTGEIQQKINEFKANSPYTTLVFHNASSRQPAAKITQMLLGAGYTASDTETDFTELQKVPQKEGTVFITYTNSGEQILEGIKSKIVSLGVAKEVNLNPRPIELKRGDIQILVF